MKSYGGLFSLLPKDLMVLISRDYLTQSDRVALASSTRMMRRLLWTPEYWGTRMEIHSTRDSLSWIMLRHRHLFDAIKTLEFGEHCNGLRPEVLTFISRKMPKLRSIDISRVMHDKLFLFGFHVLASDNLHRSHWYAYQIKHIESLLSRLERVSVNVENYSLGLYMLLDHFKRCCNNLTLSVKLNDTTEKCCTPLNQNSILRYIAGTE